MYTYLKKVLSILLLMAFLLNVCPVSTYAAGSAKDGTSTESGFMTNPLYPFLEGMEQPEDQLENAPVAAAEAADYVSLEEAAGQLRDGMVAREDTISLYIYSTTSPDFQNDVFYRAVDEDLAVGCTDGDYLKWSWKSVRWEYSTSGDYYSYTVSVTYYTTGAQETEFLSRMEDVLESMELDEKTRYQQYTAIYEYIGDNTDYDQDALDRVNDDKAQDGDYLIFTAYGALCEGDAVCQGYACLLYAMCRSAGLPVRVITNSSHAWNIVGLKDLWYNMDVTWDGQDEVTSKDYFLKGSDNFPNHDPDDEFLTEEFTTAYPISETDYEPSGDDLNGCTTHSYDEGTVVKEATCTEEGEKLYTCTVCGKTKTESVAALGHREVSQTVEATCTEDGCVMRVCSRCDYSYVEEELPALGHDLSASNTVKPTCTESGYTTYTCSRCDYTENRDETEPTGHSYTEVVTEPTCTEKGYTTHTCENCGDTYTDSYTDAKGHSWDEGVVTKETTETEDGVMTYTCEVCGETKTEAIEATGHSWDEGVVTTEATCTEDGVMTYTCQDCGETKTEVIEATGHSWDEGVVTTEPTCEETGVMTYTCQDCGETKTEAIEATGHSWDEGVVTTEPTCEETGVMTYTCQDCGETKTEVIEATGHSYSSVVTEPTCTEQGYTTYTCDACGKTYTDDYTDALGHQYDEGTVIVEPTTTKEGQIRYTCQRCRHSYVETIAATGNPFTDVPDTWYTDAVLWAVDRGITYGYPDGTFRPEANCKRCEVVTFLWRAVGEPEPETTENPFTDVASNAYYYKAVLWAYENGITTGTSATEFSPDGSCTRAQAVTFLWRLEGEPKVETEVTFTDLDENAYYLDAVAWAVAEGIAKGEGNNKFSPNKECTRAHIVTFLYRYMGE